MVSNTYVTLFAVAFFVLFIGPMLYFTWVSYKQDRHSPELGEDENDADAA